MYNINYGTHSVFHANITSHMDMVFLDTTHIAVAYSNRANSWGYVRVGVITGTSILWGTEVNIHPGVTGTPRIAKLDSTHFVVIYTDNVNNSQGKARVGSVSGTTITLGAFNTFNATRTDNIDVVGLSSSRFAVVYEDDGGGSDGICRIGAVSGTTISSYGAEAVFQTNSLGHFAMDNSITQLSPTTFAIAWTTYGDYVGTARVGSFLGTTITFGAANIFHSSNAEKTSITTLDSTHFAVSFRDDSVGVVGKAVIGLVSGTTIGSYGTTVLLPSGVEESFVAGVDSKNFLVTASSSENSYHGTSYLARVTGTTITGFSDTEDFGVSVNTDCRGAAAVGGGMVASLLDLEVANDGAAILGGVTGLGVCLVSTQASTEVVDNQAVLNGNVLDLGEEDVTVWGFYYKEGTGTPTSSDTVISSTGTASMGAYTETPIGLTANTLYSVVSFATSAEGTSTGETIEFTTTDGAPTATTQSSTNITNSAARLNGTISDEGDAEVTVRGFYYKQGSTGDPTSSDAVSSETGTFVVGAYSADIAGLLSNTNYRVAAFATNAFGTTTGNTVGFITTSLKKIVSGTIGNMSATIDSLDADTTYYVRAFATNSEGTEYGVEKSFKTHKPFVSQIIIGG